MTLAEPPYRVLPSPNHSGRRNQTRGVVIHATRSGKPYLGLQEEYEGTISYIRTPNVQASYNVVIGPWEMAVCVDAPLASWHAEENNLTHLSIGLAQPVIAMSYTRFQVEATAYVTQYWHSLFGFPLQRVFSQYQRGILGHEDTEQGKRSGKSDPGYRWPWDEFIALVREEETLAMTPEQLQELYDLLKAAWGHYANAAPHVQMIKGSPPATAMIEGGKNLAFGIRAAEDALGIEHTV